MDKFPWGVVEGPNMAQGLPKHASQGVSCLVDTNEDGGDGCKIRSSENQGSDASDVGGHRRGRESLRIVCEHDNPVYGHVPGEGAGHCAEEVGGSEQHDCSSRPWCIHVRPRSDLWRR